MGGFRSTKFQANERAMGFFEWYTLSKFSANDEDLIEISNVKQV